MAGFGEFWGDLLLTTQGNADRERRSRIRYVAAYIQAQKERDRALQEAKEDRAGFIGMAEEMARLRDLLWEYAPTEECARETRDEEDLKEWKREWCADFCEMFDGTRCRIDGWEPPA